MDSKAILYSTGNNDECYTPEYAVLPIVQYLTKSATIWCPFDTAESCYVKVLKREGFNVVFSHISAGKDFYQYEPQRWDILVSNPPFTNKRRIFERALSFGKPFAMLMNLAWLNDAAPSQLFAEKDLQLMMFDKRIRFIKPDGTTDNKITFSSGYFCWNILPKQIVMKSLRKK